MGRLLTEYEVRSIGGSGASYTSNLLCTWARAQAFNCVANGASFSSNQLVWEGSVRKKGSSAPTDYCQTCTPSCSWSLSYSTSVISCSGGTRTITATPSGSCTRYYAYSGASCGTTSCSGSTSTTVNATCADHSGTYQGVSYSFPTPSTAASTGPYPKVTLDVQRPGSGSILIQVYGPLIRTGINCCGEPVGTPTYIQNASIIITGAIGNSNYSRTINYTRSGVPYSGGGTSYYWGTISFNGVSSGLSFTWSFNGGGGVDTNGTDIGSITCGSGCSGSTTFP